MVKSSDNSIFVLQCLLEKCHEPCATVEDLNYYNNISLLSPQLLKDFLKLDSSLTEAIKAKNFQDLEEPSLQYLPGGIALLLPVCHLSQLNERILGSQVLHWRKDKVIFKHLVKAFLYSNHFDLSTMQSMDFGHDNLQWIAEVASTSNIIEARNILGRLPLLFYAPPEKIIYNGSSERFFFLNMWDDADNLNCISCNKPALRFWALSMFSNHFPEPLKNWNDLCIGRWGLFLGGATIDELNQLSEGNIDNLNVLFKYNFTSIQLRSLFDKFYSQKVLTGEEFFTISRAVTQLLPSQLIQFPLEVGGYLRSFSVPSDIAYPTLRQICYLICAASFQKQGHTFFQISEFIGALPLKTFKEVLNQPLNSSNLVEIQSRLLTKSQMYYLSAQQNIFNFKSEDIFRYSEYIRLLPAHDIISNNIASHVLLHILSKLDPTNIPQTFAVLNKLWSGLSPISIFKKILSNSQPEIILSSMPTRCFQGSEEELVSIIVDEDHIQLPQVFVVTLTNWLKEWSSIFSYKTLNKSLAFMYASVTCDDITLIDPYDFIVFMSRFNRYLKLSERMISKTLLQCCLQKLLEVLRLKSLLITSSPYKSKISLLNEAEIDAIGGNILSLLPVNAISESRHTKLIIKTIGTLSARELLETVPMYQLQNLSSTLAKNVGHNEKISYSLFDYGNLTLFLESKNIEKVDDELFKLLLEGSYIDHRICANQSVRASWYKLIKRTFGLPSEWNYQTLVTLGDFLIVVPSSDLKEVKEETWIYAADVLSTKYWDLEFESSLKFYEVCLSQLNKEEKMLYIADLKNFIATLVHAAKLQINTIVSAETLFERNKHTYSGNKFDFVDSNKEIKISFPSRKIIIDKETSQDPFAVTGSSTTISTVNYSKTGHSLNQSEFTSSYLSTPIFNKSESTTEITFGTIDYMKLQPTIPETTPTSQQLNASISNSTHTNMYMPTSPQQNFESAQDSSYFSTSTEEDSFIGEDSNLDGITFLDLWGASGTTSESTVKLRETTELQQSAVNYSIKNIKAQEIHTHTTMAPFSTTKSLHFVSSILSYGRLYTSPNNSDLVGSFTHREMNVSEPTQENINLKNHDHVDRQISNGKGVSEVNQNILESTTNNYPLHSSINDKYISNDSFKLFPQSNSSDMIERRIYFGLQQLNREDIVDQIEKLVHNKSGFLTTFLDHGSINDEDEFKMGPPSGKGIGLNSYRNTQINISGFHNRQVKVIRKRSAGNLQLSCEALKMVGRASEIILNESVILNLTEEDLTNCIDLFAEMDLPKSMQKLLWNNIKPESLVIAGKLVRAAEITDIENKKFSLDDKWSLENIYLLGKYNSDQRVRSYVATEVIRVNKKPFTTELVVSLGSLVCDLPDLNFEIIEPKVFFRSSVILGKELPCNNDCLSKLAVIAVHSDSFNDPSSWSISDVHDLGVIVSGLNISGWKALVFNNYEALNGLTEAAFDCLPYKYLKMMKRIPIEILPHAVSNRFMKFDTHNKLMKFDFLDVSHTSEPSAGVSFLPFKTLILIFCFMVFII